MTNLWVSVEESLPAEKTRVLVWFRENDPDGPRWLPRFGEISCGHWRPEGGNGNFDDRITHWMPLPCAPGVPSPPQPLPPRVYTITVLSDVGRKFRIREWGYFFAETDARKVIETNQTDISECDYYHYAVLCAQGEGPIAPPEPIQWYEFIWTGDEFLRADKVERPEAYKHHFMDVVKNSEELPPDHSVDCTCGYCKLSGDSIPSEPLAAKEADAPTKRYFRCRKCGYTAEGWFCVSPQTCPNDEALLEECIDGTWRTAEPLAAKEADPPEIA